MHELISPDSAIDPLVTRQSGVFLQVNKCLTSCGEAPQYVQLGESELLSLVQSLFLIRYWGWALIQYFVVAQ